jgi:hypothetical protein
LRIDRTISNLPDLRGVVSVPPTTNQALAPSRPISDTIRLTPLDARPLATPLASDRPAPMVFDDKGDFRLPITYGMSVYGRTRDNIRSSQETGTQLSLYV